MALNEYKIIDLGRRMKRILANKTIPDSMDVGRKDEEQHEEETEPNVDIAFVRLNCNGSWREKDDEYDEEDKFKCVTSIINNTYLLFACIASHFDRLKY